MQYLWIIVISREGIRRPLCQSNCRPLVQGCAVHCYARKAIHSVAHWRFIVNRFDLPRAGGLPASSTQLVTHWRFIVNGFELPGLAGCLLRPGCADGYTLSRPLAVHCPPLWTARAGGLAGCPIRQGCAEGYRLSRPLAVHCQPLWHVPSRYNSCSTHV